MRPIVEKSTVTAIADPVTVANIPANATGVEASCTLYTDDTATTVATAATGGTWAATVKPLTNEYDVAMTGGTIDATAPGVATTAVASESVTVTPTGITGGNGTHYVLRVAYKVQ